MVERNILHMDYKAKVTEVKQERWVNPEVTRTWIYVTTQRHGSTAGKKDFLVSSPGQTIATCQHNISQHCWAQHVACAWLPCCDMLRHVGCCWLKFDQFQTWANNAQHVATHHNTVAKRTHHVALNNVAICCVDMLRSFGRDFREFIKKVAFYPNRTFFSQFIAWNFDVMGTLSVEVFNTAVLIGGT